MTRDAALTYRSAGCSPRGTRRHPRRGSCPCAALPRHRRGNPSETRRRERPSSARIHTGCVRHRARAAPEDTPNISDPGGLIVKEVAAAGFEVVPIPGVSAVTAAYSVSGLEHTSFHFYGFLPTTSSQRIKVFESLQTQSCPMIFYEAPHRIIKTLNDMADFFGNQHEIVVARELTKTFESIYRGQISKVKETIESDSNFQKGEFVILVSPIHHEKKELLTEDQHRILEILLNHMPTNAAVKLGVEILNINKNYLYDEALKIKKHD